MPTNVWHTTHTINDERGNTTAACVIKWMNRHTPHGMRTHMRGTPRTICDQRHTRPAGSQSRFKDTRHTACPHTMCGTPRTIRDQRTHGQVGHKVDLKTHATHGMTTHLWHTAHDPRPKAQTRPAGSQGGLKDTRHTRHVPTPMRGTPCGTPRTIRDQRTHGQLGHTKWI